MASSTKQDEQAIPFGAIAFLVLLFAVCVAAAPLAMLHSPIWGLFAAVMCFLLWFVAGPSPMPGFLPGVLGMMVLVANLAVFLGSVVRLVLR